MFLGNLREFTNRVLETERQAEADLIQARKDAEALQIISEAENNAERERLKLERDRAKITSQAEMDQAHARIRANIIEAKAMDKSPELMRLRELQALEKIAHIGASFVISLGEEFLSTIAKGKVE